MLDEAIEYLKQMQLQVQVLTIRNGVSLHPGYTLGGPLQPTLVSSSGLSWEMVFVPQFTSAATQHSHSRFLPSVVQSLENQYVDFNQLDISCSRNNSPQSRGISL